MADLKEILDNAAWNLPQSKWQEWAKLILAENERLKKAFTRYAAHDPDCHKISIIGSDNDCTCGVDQALKDTNGKEDTKP